jgi:hypothetical protein
MDATKINATIQCYTLPDLANLALALLGFSERRRPGQSNSPDSAPSKEAPEDPTPPQP